MNFFKKGADRNSKWRQEKVKILSNFLAELHCQIDWTMTRFMFLNLNCSLNIHLHSLSKFSLNIYSQIHRALLHRLQISKFRIQTTLILNRPNCPSLYFTEKKSDQKMLCLCVFCRGEEERKRTVKEHMTQKRTNFSTKC